ncbi:DoxX family protein, partial [Escherichia coli]|nr:DoxX family protein [Escherichia coli]
MENFKSYVSLAARVLLAVIFVIAGYGKLGSIEGTQGYMAMVGLPGFLVWPTIALELLGGLALIAGFQTRLIALALAGFTLVAAVLFHFQP